MFKVYQGEKETEEEILVHIRTFPVESDFNVPDGDWAHPAILV